MLNTSKKRQQVSGVSPTKAPSLDAIRNEVKIALTKVSSSLELKPRAVMPKNHHHLSSEYSDEVAVAAYEEEQLAIDNLKKVRQLRRL